MQETEPLLMTKGISRWLQNCSIRLCCTVCWRDQSLVMWLRTCYSKPLGPESKTPAVAHGTILQTKRQNTINGNSWQVVQFGFCDALSDKEMRSANWRDQPVNMLLIVPSDW